MDDLNTPHPAPEQQDNYQPVIPEIKEVTISQAPALATVSQNEIDKQKKRSNFKLAGIIFAVMVSVWLILNYVVTFIVVNGISMHPTFYTNNVVILWEFPETWAKITGSQYIPNRGNIVILKQTKVSGEELIKRVVGLPDENIVISNGNVRIYNQSNPNGFNPDTVYFKTVPSDTAGLVNSQIGSGSIFVIGDNRAPGASIDSRSSIGPVPASGIEGKVILRIFPFNQIKVF